MSNTRKAEIYFGKLAYKNAIELYERVLEKNPKDLNAKLRIAECYMAMNDPVNAIHWYDDVMKEAELGPKHKYNYAQALSSLGNYDEAYKWYQYYSSEIPDDPRGKSKLDFLQNINFYRRDSTLYFIKSLSFNSTNSDFGAVPYEDGLVFLSSRDEDLFIKYDDTGEELGTDSDAEAPLDLYFAQYNDSIYLQPRKLNPLINSKFNEGPLAFYHHSRKVIFTRNNYLHFKKGFSSDGKIKLKLYESVRDGKDNWLTPESFPYNNDDYSTAHPSLSSDDQTLYFSSDMPGGYGGSDIYYCKWENGSWGQPVNLGPEINTAGDEMYPFISDDDNLYFTSDGHGGFGGMDIYRSYRLSDLFGHVENLGFPINTNSDDFSFYLNEDGRSGYFASNRPGGLGEDDVYSFDVRYLNIVGKVLESQTQDFVADATVTLFDSTNNSYRQYHTNDQGYFYADLPLDSRFNLEAIKDGYSPEGYTHVNSTQSKFETDTVTVYMWKHRLFAEGRAFSNETHELLTGVTVTLDNLSDNKLQTLKTSDDGTYFFVLQPDKKYQIEAELADHVVSNFIINTQGLLEDTLRNDFVLEEVYLDKNVIFFDFDQSAIKPDYAPALDQMVDVLKKHPTTYIFIGAHADAKGSLKYNQALSERRAKSVVAYLRSKGIKSNRITWKGYGEELLINRCSDGVECPEEEQAKNRRAELKIEHQKSEAPLDPDKK